MSHIENGEFNKIFLKFTQKFPPADNLQEAVIRLTTTDISEMIYEFNPDEMITPQLVFEALKEAGYKYEPVEYNEKVTFYWLFKKSKEAESF